MDFIKRTEEIWHMYFWGDADDSFEDIFAPECVIIGTGKHEFYRTREEFFRILKEEVEERDGISFQIKDFWCEKTEIAPDVCMTYGDLFIWGESRDKSAVVNMDSRFTMIYKKYEDGWKIIHVHQSLPNMEQADGEYYPKTLMEQVMEERKKADTLAQLAFKDSLTGLVNYRIFEESYRTESREGVWLFVADLDNFKNINDTYGHMEGNRILKKVAEILKSSVRSGDQVCRMGGDEFAILCGRLRDEKEAREVMRRIQSKVTEMGKQEQAWVSLSIGGAMAGENEPLEAVLERADQALYEVKRGGKNGGKIHP